MTQSMVNSDRERRKILVVEDNELNCELLTEILQDEYQVLTAENGEEGLWLMAQHCLDLSLVLLDLYMPVCDGFEFLERVRADELMSAVPVMVETGSNRREDETRCLQLGAVDFITKPYNPEVVRSRVRGIIRLRESAATLSAVERDELTGMYTMEAFSHHVQKEILSHRSRNSALVVTDVREYKLITSVFGKKAAENALAYLARRLLRYAGDSIAGRQGDKFFFFFPDRVDLTAESLESVLTETLADAPIPNLRIKAGVYRDVDTSQPVSVLCDRVILAAESVKSDFSVNVAFYDQQMQARMVEASRIEAAFAPALRNREIKVHYQPKVDAVTGRIVGAEALARWELSDGSMLSPAKFVPLIEQDGQIGALDEYMFREVCLFQSERLRAGKPVVPISVNLSRASLYRIGALSRYLSIIREVGIPLELVPIELTESVTTQGAALRLTQEFVDAGFQLHMDDFGTGYTSMTSFTSIPFRVIKLDKSLIDQIGQPKGDVVIRYMVQIAHEVGEKIVAEGVEHLDQAQFLQTNGCDTIQGYYYYRPMSGEAFEKTLEGN